MYGTASKINKGANEQCRRVFLRTYKLSFEYTYLIRESEDRQSENRTNLFSDSLTVDFDSLLIKHHCEIVNVSKRSHVITLYDFWRVRACYNFQSKHFVCSFKTDLSRISRKTSNFRSLLCARNVWSELIFAAAVFVSRGSSFASGNKGTSPSTKPRDID